MDRLKLFDNDGDSSDEEPPKIEVNREFAKRYEYNKRREELQKYEELKKKGLVDSSDSDSEGSSEEEESTNPSKKSDAKFFDALIKVKKRDPVLREHDTKLFNSDEDEDQEENGNKKKGKKEKPMYLKDVVSKQLIEEGPEFSDEEDEIGDGGGFKNKVKSYSEEQEEERQRFVKALEVGENDVDDDSGDLLRMKSNADEEEEEEEDDGFEDKLEEYFSEDEKLDDDDKFLKGYFRNRMWVADGKSKLPGDVDIDVSEDEDDIEKQEEFERNYNFRFEENAGDRVMGHSRKVEGSVRKKDNPRKSQRERKEERKEQAEFERKEDLKRVKNLKKKEINEKLEKIIAVGGLGKDKKVFDKYDLDEEFDPEAHDRKMKEAYNEDYYGEEDHDIGSGGDEEFEKPNFDKEDELLGLGKGWYDAGKLGEGFKSDRERIMKNRVASGNENLVDEDGDEEPKEGKRKRKRKMSEVEKAVREELMDEYYKLDYEDTIEDLNTRFKYKPVKAKRYRLTTEDVLLRDDKELNQYVPLKKLAPYREKEWEVPKNKIIQLKKSKPLMGNTSRPVNDDKGSRHHGGSKAKEEEVNAVESERSQPVESNGDKETISRKRKRKQKQAELKISQSRLMAYGKIPSKSKSKNQ